MLGINSILLLLIFFCNWTNIGTFRQSNLLLLTEFIPSKNLQERKIYSSQDLRQIRSEVNKDQRLRVLPPSLVCRIRSLKLHRKKSRKERGGRVRLLSNKINNNNLITVATSDLTSTTSIANSNKILSLGLANV